MGETPADSNPLDKRVNVVETASRFDCPSLSLRPRQLLRLSRRASWVALVAAIAVHVAATQLGVAEDRARVSQPLSTRFIKRQPRLTKPLEMRKTPRPRRRRIERTMVSVKARADRHARTAGPQVVHALHALGTPQATQLRGVWSEPQRLEPRTMAAMIEGAREPESVVDINLEMVGVSALDTGKYHALVIQDPSDKRQIKGFFHLLLARPHSLSVFGGRGNKTSVWDDLKISISLMGEAMNEYTGVRTDVVGQITFDCHELFKVPWVMTPIPNPFVRLTASEALNMGQYLAAGGFQFLENAWGRPGPIFGHEKATRQIARESLGSAGLREGKDWQFEILSGGHPVYHCYFDFDAPPPGKDLQSIRNHAGRTMHEYLEGVTINGRLWILFGQKGYTIAIHDFRAGGPYEGWGDIKRPLQFCVNTIVFALTQEGSVTNRVMDIVSH